MGGYIIDMVIFAAVAMIIVVISGAVLLIQTSGATDDPSNSAVYTFLGLIGIGVPAVWTALNLALLATRGQTGGQYVAGLRLRREDGGAVTTGNAVGWWFALNPLLYSWPMAALTGGPLAVMAMSATSAASFAVFVAIVVVCAIAPVAALFAAMLDGQNRALHDRIARTVVAPAAGA